MILSFIKAASLDLKRTSSQRAFLEELVESYSDLLLRVRHSFISYNGQLISQQAQRNEVSADQFQAAYPALVEAAAKHSDLCRDTCIMKLQQTPAPDVNANDTWQQTILLTRVACAAYVPLPGLKLYLNEIAHAIAATTDNEHRLALNSTIFKLIMEDLPDSHRRTGMEWWSERKNQLQSGLQAVTPQSRM